MSSLLATMRRAIDAADGFVAMLRLEAHEAALAAIRGVGSLAQLLVSGGFVAFVLLVTGCALAVAGVHLLFGLGWALIAAAVPCLAAGWLTLRGVIHGQ